MESACISHLPSEFHRPSCDPIVHSIREASAHSFSVALQSDPSILDEVTVHSLPPGLDCRAVWNHWELLGPYLRAPSVLPDQPTVSWVCLALRLLLMTHWTTLHSWAIMPLSPDPRKYLTLRSREIKASRPKLQVYTSHCHPPHTSPRLVLYFTDRKTHISSHVKVTSPAHVLPSI